VTKYIFRGRLQGALCGDCFEPLSGVKVRLYRARPDQDVTRLAVADPKTTLTVLTEEQVRAKQASLLGEFDTDDAGNFSAALGETVQYAGEAFEVDVYCGTVPHHVPKPSHGPVQFSITTVQPQWRERESGLLAAWDYRVPARFWCFIRALFDAWVICGQVTVCSTKLPAEGVKVLAFDRDWLADDPLGSGLTDATGHFRIDYSGADFRRGTWINVELFGGPDVYFRIESMSGDILLDEPPSQGRSAGRENIGPCFCVDLCVEEAPIVRHAWFTRVGDVNVYSDISNTTGLTVSAQPAGFPNQHGGPGFGFWGSLKLIGDCPTTHPAGGQPMRYRFLTRPAGSVAAPSPVTGAAMVDAVKAGTRPVPWNFGAGINTYPQDIWIAGSGGYTGPMPAPLPPGPPGSPPGSWGSMPPLILQPDSQGWVTMPPDATNQGFSGPLLRLLSNSLAPGGAAPGSGAGNPIAPSNQKSGLDFEIIYEAEPVSGPAITGPTLTNALDRIHINNWYEVAEISLDQFTAPGADACSGITNAVDIRYTMDHELVRDWSLSISTSAAIPGGTPVLPGLGIPPVPPDESATARGGNGVHHLDTTLWPACAYAVIFTRRLKLTDGENDDLLRSPMVALFCRK
jgi:hypothetical protein